MTERIVDKPSPPPAPARPPNYLAEDIRAINEWRELPDDARRYVTRLADRVQALTETETVTSELDVALSGLEPEQEIRARALEIAAKVATAEISFPASNPGEVLALAEGFADWIRTGQRPPTQAELVAAQSETDSAAGERPVPVPASGEEQR